jgi:hypothetical protein
MQFDNPEGLIDSMLKDLENINDLTKIDSVQI